MDIKEKVSTKLVTLYIVFYCDIICHHPLRICGVFINEQDARNCAKDEQILGHVMSLEGWNAKMNDSAVNSNAEISEVYFVYSKKVSNSPANKGLDVGKIYDVKCFLKNDTATYYFDENFAKDSTFRKETKMVQMCYIPDPPLKM